MDTIKLELHQFVNVLIKIGLELGRKLRSTCNISSYKMCSICTFPLGFRDKAKERRGH